MIPTPRGPGDLPPTPERPEPMRITPPPATALGDQIDELQRRVRDLEGRLKAIEARLVVVEKGRQG